MKNLEIMDSPPMLPVRELARRLGVSEKTARRLLWTGKIGYHRVSGSIRVTEDQLSEYLTEVAVSPFDVVSLVRTTVNF